MRNLTTFKKENPHHAEIFNCINFIRHGALILLLIAGMFTNVTAQVTVAGAIVGNGSYPTLGAAFIAINGGAQSSAVITIAIIGSTTETATAQLNSGAWTSITISPSGGTWTISGNVTGPLILFNGASNVTIDGLNSGGNSLTVSNNLAASGVSTIEFANDAINNTVQNCTISGSCSSTASGGGTIYFGAGSVTGNINNNINNCNIGPAGGSLPVNAIYSSGISATIANSNIINANNIFDFFSAGSASVGINIGATGNNAWTITNNRLYQSATRLYTTANTHNGINIGSGAGYAISGNIIGFANSGGTGTTNMVGNTTAIPTGFPGSYVASAAASNVAIQYVAIKCAFTAGGAVSNIQGNTVGGFAMYTSAAITTVNGDWCGIDVASGNVNIGTTTGNTIGATSGQSSIYSACTVTGGTVVGIYAASTNTVTIQNNTIGAIDAVGTSNATIGSTGGFTGIDCNLAGGVYIVSYNNIGNTTADNIRTGYTATAGSLSNTGSLLSSSGLTGAIVGIRNYQLAATSIDFSHNIIQGLACSGTSTAVTGITNSGAVASTLNISNNSLGTASLGFIRYAFANSGILTGISCTSSNTNSIITIQNNDFQGIVYSIGGTGANNYISWFHTSSTSTITGNTFTNLNVNTTGSITFFTRSGTLVNSGPVDNCNNNSIVGTFNKTGAGGTITLFSSAATSVSGSFMYQTGNNFSNITVSGATIIAGWANTDGTSATSGPTKTITGNTFSNWNGGTGTITVISVNMGNNGTNVSNNTISDITSAGSITGISIGTANGGAVQTYSNNTISGLNSTGTTSTFTVTGITGGSTSITTTNINNNTIDSLYSAAVKPISGPVTAAAVRGIVTTNGTTVNIFTNKIYQLNETSTHCVAGIDFESNSASASTTNIYYNLIGQLYASTSTVTQAVLGIALNFGGTSTTNSCNIYYNTVYLDGNCPQESYCVYMGSQNPTVTSRNNIFVNNATPIVSLLPQMVYFRITGLTASYSVNSNNNLLYAGSTTDPLHLIYADGTVASPAHPQQTLSGFQTFAGTTRESVSVTENPPFLSINGVDATFLHLNGTICTHAESGAAPIAGYTDDYDAIGSRVGPYPLSPVPSHGGGIAPDIGAVEFDGTLPAPTLTTSATGVTCTGGSNGTATVSAVNASFPYTYIWSSGATTSVASNLSAGTYTVAVIARGTGTCYTVATATVTQPLALSASSAGAPVSCSGGSNGTAAVTATNGTIPYSYSWSNNSTASSITGLSADTYNVTVTDNCGTSVTSSFTITSPGALDISCSGTPVSTCQGGANGTASVVAGSGTPPYNYLWSNASTASSISGLTASAYSVTVTDAHGCSLACTYTVTEPTAVNVSAASNTPVCAGANLNLSSSPTGGTVASAYSYSWTGPNGFASTDANPVISSATSAANSGTYSLTVSDDHSCSASTVTTVTVVDCNTYLNLHLIIEGYYVGSGQMNPVMYNEAVNGATLSQVDTIIVELHDTAALSGHAVIQSVKTILMTNDSATAIFDGARTGNIYYIGIRHRNAIQTWSAAPVAFTATTNYDFTNARSQAYGSNQVRVDVSPDLWALYNGDINQDGNIDLIDFPPLDSGINNGYFGYYATDLNGDGNVDLLDFPVLDANINAGIFSQHP